MLQEVSAMRTALALVAIVGIGLWLGASAAAQNAEKSDPTPAPEKANAEMNKRAREQWEAQQESMRRGQVRSIADANPLKKPVTVDFPGGTINQYIDAVQAAAGEYRVISFVSDDLKVPRIKLDNVSMMSALVMLEWCDASPLGPNAAVVLDREEDAVYVRTVTRGTRTFVEETRVWSIRSILDGGGLRAEDVLAAVQAALALQGESASVSYHAETAIVMSIGRSDQMQVINSLIGTLAEDVRSKVKSKEAAQASRDAEIAAMKSGYAEMEKRLSDALERLEKESTARRSLEARVALMGAGRLPQ
jgi:hypothetical protein